MPDFTDIATFQRQNELLICVDSDGCVLDTMEVKQRRAFIPLTLKYWGLEPLGDVAWQMAAFVFLYSTYRGLVRYELLIKLIDFLHADGHSVPDIGAIRDFVANPDYANTLPELKRYEVNHPAPNLNTAIVWAKAIDSAVRGLGTEFPIFPLASDCLHKMQAVADVVVVSVTPTEQLRREWQAHHLTDLPDLITGQEYGAKAKRIAALLEKGYAKDQVLMMGDAPGDWRAAKANDVCFYPILAGQETQSWKDFYDQYLADFLAGRYSPQQQNALVDRFNANLPDRPPK